MRKEYDFSHGIRGSHVGKHIQIVGDISSTSTADLETSASSKTTHTLIGTAGEYYVCAELCRLGYLALLTPKNNPLFDVVATNVDGTTSVSVQVKTRSMHNKQGWKLNKEARPSKTPGVPFVVLVNLRDELPPLFYIYRYTEFLSRVSEIFETYISKPKRNGEPRKDPGFRWFDESNFIESDRVRLNNWQPIIRALERKE
jgi:hypothetical protein